MERVRQRDGIAELWVADILRENADGSTWTNTVALLATTGTLGALYPPPFIH